MSAGDVRLEGSDGAELVEMLGFVRDWLGSADSEALAASLGRFVGSDGYDLAELCADLGRFVFLLGGDDGPLLFGSEKRLIPSRRRWASSLVMIADRWSGSRSFLLAAARAAGAPP